MDNFINTLFENLKEFLVFFYNKPYHFFFVGLTMLLIYIYLVKNNYLLITSLVLTFFFIVTIIEILCNKNKRKNDIDKYYKELRGLEKETFDDKGYVTAIYSLVGKGFGCNISYGGDFMMYQEVYNQLSELKAKNK